MSKEKIKSRWLFFGKDKYTYDTIDELVNKSMGLAVGEVVTLNGYYSADDGATHKRVIADSDDGSGVQLRSGKWANIVHNGEVNVSWFGAKGDGVFDNTLLIQKAIEYTTGITTLYFPKGIYLITSPLYLHDSTSLIGEDSSSIKKNSTTKGEGEFSDIDAFFIIRSSKNTSDTVYDVKIDNIRCVCDDMNNDRYGLYARYYFAKYHIRKFTTSKVAHGFRIVKGTWLSYLVFSNFFDCKTGVVIESTSASTTMKLEENYVMYSSEKAYSLSGGYFECNNLASDYASGINYEFRFATGVINGLGIESGNCTKGIVFTNSNMCINSAVVLGIENSKSRVVELIDSRVIFNNCKFNGGKGQLYYITNNSSAEFNSCTSGTYDVKSILDGDSYRNKISINDKYSNGGMFDGYYELGIIGKEHNSPQIVKFDSTHRNPISIIGYTHNGLSKSYTGRNLQYLLKLNENTRVLVDNPLSCGYNSLAVTSYIQDIKCLGMLSEQVTSTGSYRKFKITDFSTEKTAEFNLFISPEDVLIIGNNTFQVTSAIDYINKTLTLYKGDWSGIDILNKPILIRGSGETPATQTVASAIIQSGSKEMRPKVDLRIGTQYFDLNLGKPIYWNGTSWVDSTGTNATGINTAQLNTLYHGEKMKEEGVYEDFIMYMDDKVAYDKEQRKLEEQRQLAYQKALEVNPELTYDEWLSQQPALLPYVEEPRPTSALQKFMDKYL